jgi:hypothetical protein
MEKQAAQGRGDIARSRKTSRNKPESFAETHAIARELGLKNQQIRGYEGEGGEGLGHT